MALSVNEGTSQEVMNLFSMPAGFTAGYVNIKHVEVQYPNSMVIVVIGKYASEEARNSNEDNCIMEGIGFPITAEALAAIKTTDDRDVVYPYVAAQIQYLALEEEKPNESDFTGDAKETLYNEAKQAYNDKVQAIYDELSLENPYKEQVYEETETAADIVAE